MKLLKRDLRNSIFNNGIDNIPLNSRGIQKLFFLSRVREALQSILRSKNGLGVPNDPGMGKAIVEARVHEWRKQDNLYE